MLPPSADAGRIMRVVVFGTYDDRVHPRVAVLREGFAAHGDEVIPCNEPLDVDTATRVRIVQRPWHAAGAVARLARAWWRLRRRAGTIPPPDLVLVGYLGQLDVHLARWLWRDGVIALDYLTSAGDTVADRQIGSRAAARALGRLDAAALRKSDIVVVDTVEHLVALEDRFRSRGIIVPVGAPSAWFRAPRTMPVPPLRVVFFGVYTPLQGAPVIGEAIALLSGEPIEFTMIGRGQDLEATRTAAGSNERVTWVDWIEPEHLPPRVGSHHVCLGIFSTGPKALRVVPNKVYQGAAAGCAIVTSDTEPQRRALAGAAVFVPPGDPRALADALRTLARDAARVEGLRWAAYDVADRRYRPGSAVALLRERVRGSLPP